jgi:hypothetical protein
VPDIYTPVNTIEAYLLQGALQAEGIPCEIRGEHLQGGAGLLPVNDNVTLHVREEDVKAAQALIARYERGELSAE